MPKINSESIISTTNKIQISILEWEDESHAKRKWDVVRRVNNHGTVTIIPMIDESIILVRQYRPVIDSYTIEFPAGMMEMNEDSKSAALRELKEETGCTGEIMSETHSFNSLGITDESTYIFIVKVTDITEQELDSDEHISTFKVNLCSLNKFLAERQKIGDKIDSKVCSFSLGCNYA